MKIKIVVPGDAQAQMRPRATTIGGSVRMYDHPKSKQYKKHVQKAAAPYLPQKPLTGALSMKVTVYRGFLKSFSKRQRVDAEGGLLLPVTRPDVDNLAKTFMDALNGLAYIDDSQIVTLIAEKKYAEFARVEIEIFEVK